MSESIVLDTPEQINMWVLLSRRGQVQLHLKGLKVKGIMAALKRDIPGCENIRRVREAIVPIEYAISEAGGDIDYRLVNMHVMRKATADAEVFVDAGIYNSPADITDPTFLEKFQAGLLEVVLTLDEPRNPNGMTYVSA